MTPPDDPAVPRAATLELTPGPLAIGSPAGGPSAARFGTWGGVFTPCLLTILGVIMFMRFGYVTGHAGLWGALGILALAKAITTLTTLSLSAIATNIDVRVGGVYFMISRVLGPDFGGSIGITLFLAQAVSVAFYTIGFTEALFSVASPFLGEATAAQAVAMKVPQMVSTAVIAGLFALTFKGAGVAMKAQYVVLVILMLAVVSIVVGGILRFDPELFTANKAPAFTEGLTFWAAFAIFFPAATGISAGANMSGDLKDPGRSIPRGTLLAIALSALIYGAEIVLLAGANSRQALQDDGFGALKAMSLLSPLIVLGVFAATLSSALGSFLGAPRILQAMGQDRLMKFLVLFGQGAGQNNEPRRATVLTFAIAVGIIWAGDLNAVAEVISMFFLIAYGMINLSAFVESKSANPSFRPRFKAFHWSTALVGAIGSVVAMMKINETYALVAVGIAGTLYFYLRKRDIQTNWGDAKHGYIFSRTRDNLFLLERSKWHPKNWRPILAAISPDPLADRGLVEMGGWLESRRGLYTVAQILDAPELPIEQRLALRQQRREEIARCLEVLDIVAFSEAVVTTDFQEGLSTFLQSYSVGGLRPNTLLLAIPPALDSGARARFHATVATLRPFDYNLVFYKPGTFALDKRRRLVDLWWRKDENGSLMALLAYLMTRGRIFGDSRLRIFRSEPDPKSEARTRRKLQKSLAQARIAAEIDVFHSDASPEELIRARSAGVADLVMLGVGPEDLANFPAYLARMDPLLDSLPTTLLVASNGEADLFA